MRPLLIVIFFWIDLSLAADSAPEKISGLVLYNQLKITAATQQLQIESNDENSDSQYYLAEIIRKKSRYMAPEAQHWYEKAAEKDNIYAMIQLGRHKNDFCQKIGNCPPFKKTQAEWFAQAKGLVLPKAQEGDPESLYLMYEITLNRDWLEKSATAGYPLAQYWMAISERQGEGFFLIPGKRDASVKKWLLLSSEGGYPKAMMDYLEILHREGDTASIRQWLELAARSGYQVAVSSYGAYISHTPDKLDYPLDLVKGYALFTLLKDLGDAGGIGRYVERKGEEIREKMTPAQIEDSERIAKEWKTTHPPLSFFPDKLGF
jgi:TPR repeat protein